MEEKLREELTPCTKTRKKMVWIVHKLGLPPPCHSRVPDAQGELALEAEWLVRTSQHHINSNVLIWQLSLHACCHIPTKSLSKTCQEIETHFFKLSHFLIQYCILQSHSYTVTIAYSILAQLRTEFIINYNIYFYGMLHILCLVLCNIYELVIST